VVADERAPAIAVVGGINVDFVMRAARLPGPGETLTGATLAQAPGGKGANQALAARRLGADVRLAGRVGDDEHASLAQSGLVAAGVDLSAVAVDPVEPTGIAMVTVADNGENHIVVASGANANVSAADVSAVSGEVRGGAVLCQLEVGIDAVVAAARLESVLFCVNAAPSRSLSSDVWARAGLVIVNEVEHAQLRPELEGFGGLLATTHGADGACLFEAGQEIARAAPPHVAVVDTTGAGDAFAAALVVGLLEGRSHATALARATAAGSLATTKCGAQAGLPTAEQIDKALT
jgi:ribokinase